ncbi:MAG: hypothetical protein AB1393_11655 [Candidatus Edwardsbacteria bacterium]
MISPSVGLDFSIKPFIIVPLFKAKARFLELHYEVLLLRGQPFHIFGIRFGSVYEGYEEIEKGKTKYETRSETNLFGLMDLGISPSLRTGEFGLVISGWRSSKESEAEDAK